MAARVALTFEAGGEPTPTRPILAALDAAGVEATFFLDGRWAEANPELVRAIAAGGHELGNHGYRHDDWTTMDADEIAADLAATERVVERLTGATVRPWSRPPFGAVDDRVLEVLGKAGYHTVYRDAVDGAHWPGETTAASVRERALRSAHDGAVVVFHTNRPETPEALPAVLEALLASGFVPGPLSRLGRVPSPRLARHPDFEVLEIRTGYVRPLRSGRWQSIPLLELGASATQPPNAAETVAAIDGSSLDLVTGDAGEPLPWRGDASDRYLLVLAGDVRCDFRSAGEDAGYLVARPGELFLCPASIEHRLGPAQGRRWVAVVWRAAEP
jgi:peptidoglycan/xylan/chitin deacetylase (PgdA/CDA1 family)